MALISVAEALDHVLAHAAPLPAEEAPLAEADGRVLAYDLKALRTQPPADVSAMDGYAVRATDVAKAPVRLKVIGEVPAGRPFTATIGTRRSGAHLHRRLRARRRRRGGGPGIDQDAMAIGSRCKSRQPRAAMCARKDSISAQAMRCSPAGHRLTAARSRAGGRHEPSAAAGLSPAETCPVRHRR